MATLTQIVDGELSSDKKLRRARQIVDELAEEDPEAAEKHFPEFYFDQQTGFYDKTVFETQKLPKLVKKNKTLGYALIDIDNTKVINDTYGHDIGDGVILYVVDMIKASTRKDDTLYGRLGDKSDEFGIALPGATAEQVYEVGERIRQAVEQGDKTKYRIPEEVKVTVSIGVTELRQGTRLMMREADRALYASKENRNKVSCSWAA